ncbi:S-adenosylmethionine decarboxylase proenzyme [Capsicum annuum]|nr:S-adenosylmethionine decarboxylase proenzyme [Capsicum annuum]
MALTNFILTVAGVSAVILLLRSDVKQSASIFKRNVRQIRHWLEEESASAAKEITNESKGGKKFSSKSSLYEALLGYSIEDVRPNGGIKKFRSAAYSNPGLFADPEGKGLQSHSKAQLDEFLGPAECIIIDSLSNEWVDFYLPSESSLFIYLYKIIIKTCGTSKLLHSIPAILKLADTLSLKVQAVKYSRGSFIFPGAQLFPHRHCSEEVSILDTYFGKFSSGSKALILDSPEKPQKWHVYSALAGPIQTKNPVYTLEMFVTNLDRKKASVFYKSESSSVAQMTTESVTRKILPYSDICDFELDPCGKWRRQSQRRYQRRTSPRMTSTRFFSEAVQFPTQRLRQRPRIEGCPTRVKQRPSAYARGDVKLEDRTVHAIAMLMPKRGTSMFVAIPGSAYGQDPRI